MGKRFVIWCVYSTKSEPISKINKWYIPQGKALTRDYARALAKRESGNVLTHRTAQMAGNEPFGKMDSVLRNNFAGEGFAKPRLMFLKFGRIRVSAPQEGAGGMRGGFFWDLARRAMEK